jgi:hypothetical protein
VIVYVDSNSDQTSWLKVPALVQLVLIRGEFIPTIVVTDSAVSKVSTSLTYDIYKLDDRKAIRGLKKVLKAE